MLEEHGAVEALRELQREGKVRFLGMSGVLPHLTDHIEMGVFDAFQIPYSALQRDHEPCIRAAALFSKTRAPASAAARARPRT